MRLLTLACFFNFCGLNNGFTYTIISQGKVERLDIASAVAVRACSALNPTSWKKSVSGGIGLWLLLRSGQTVEASSRGVLKSLAQSSSEVQNWFLDACSMGEGAVSLHAGAITGDGGLKNAVFPLSAYKVFRSDSEDSNKYIGSGREEAWIQSSKQVFWTGKRTNQAKEVRWTGAAGDQAVPLNETALGSAAKVKEAGGFGWGLMLSRQLKLGSGSEDGAAGETISRVL